MGSLCTNQPIVLPDSSKVVQGTQIPEWVSAGGKQLFEQAIELAQQEYPQYTGDRVATYDNINMLSTLYDNVLDYLSEDSEYTKWCNNGWPLSDANNEFSNELFKYKAIRSENLIKYAYDDVILVNNHCLYKYHLMKNNMWDDGKSVFLNKQFWEYDQTCNI